MSSIRRRLIVGILVSLLVILAGSGTALYVRVRAALFHDFDAALLAKARALATLARRDPGNRIEFDFAEDLMPEFERSRHPEYFEIRLEDGRVLEKSPSLGDARLAIQNPDPNSVEGDRFHDPDQGRDTDREGDGRHERRFGEAVRFQALELPNGRAGRAVALRFVPQAEHEEESGHDEKAESPPSGPWAVVVVARNTDELQELLGSLLAGLAGIGILLPVIVALMAALIVRHGLRPLDRLAREAGTIHSGTLSHRFPETGMPAELAPICTRLNDLLHRLQEAFARERRFTADVAHELRTPVAELRSTAEVALLDPADLPGVRHAVSESLDIALQMEKLIDALLSITRCEAGIRTLNLQSVVLDDALRQAWKPIESRARTRRISVSWEIPEGTEVNTDPDLLQVILGNLLSNAVDYSTEEGRVACRAETRGEKVHLSVTNPAPDLDRDDLPHLFEPFWRKDKARSDASHTGLGLALVSAAASLLGAEPDARLSDSGQLTVEIALGGFLKFT